MVGSEFSSYWLLEKEVTFTSVQVFYQLFHSVGFAMMVIKYKHTYLMVSILRRKQILFYMVFKTFHDVAILAHSSHS